VSPRLPFAAACFGSIHHGVVYGVAAIAEASVVCIDQTSAEHLLGEFDDFALNTKAVNELTCAALGIALAELSVRIAR
jgi:hypothetical protein